MIKRKKYIAVFLIKEQLTYTILSVKRFIPSESTVRFKDKTFVITINKPTYSKGMKLFYFVDIEVGQLNFDNTKKSNINPKAIDMILSQKIITELTNNLSGSFKMNLYNIIIGLLIGALGGFIVGGYV